MEFYIGNNEIEYVKNELLPTVIALEYANILCQYAVDNWIVSGTTSTVYTATYGATASPHTDSTILSDNGTYGGNCERIKATIDTLFNLAIGILIPERNTYYGRYYDASNLIDANKQLIAEVAVGRMLANYPGFSVPNGNQNCIDDIIDNLTAIVYDLRNGGNARIYDYAQLYTINPVLGGEQTESNYAFNQARDMAIQAMRNQTITIGGYSTLTQVKDLTIIADGYITTTAATGNGTTATLTFANQGSAPFTIGQTITVSGITPTGYNGSYVVTACTATTVSYANTTTAAQTVAGTVGSNTSANSCSNVASAITTLFSILTTAISNGNMNHVTRQSESDSNKLYRDAAKLLIFNKEYIKYEALQRTLNNYPGFSVPGGNSKCLRDIGYVIDAIVYDLLTDGNSAIVEAATSYIDATTGTITSLDGELIQSIYAYQRVKELIRSAVAETLITPAPASGQVSYVDPSVSITGASLTEIQSFTDARMDILLGVLNNPTYIATNEIIATSALTIPTKSYPTRNALTPVSGSISVGDYFYGISSGEFAEFKSIIFNRGKVRKILKRFTITYDNPVEIFERGQEITRIPSASGSCTIDSIENGEFVSYIDVVIISGSFSIGQTIVNDDGYTAEITDITNRVQLTNVIGEFEDDQYITGLYSNFEGILQNYEYNNAPVLSNTGGRLIIETESLFGEFLVGRTIYSSITEKYIDVAVKDGSPALSIGSIIQSSKIYQLTVEYDNVYNIFDVGGTIFRDVELNKKATILGYEIINSTTAYLYISNVTTTIYSNGDSILYYKDIVDIAPTGQATIINVSEINSQGYARVEKVTSVGQYTRLYLSNIVGDINVYSEIISDSNYCAGVVSAVDVVGRISRTFLGFNGVQTTFKLTTNNGDQYFPDNDGFVLVFVNGILQPPNASYTTFSDTIEFTEAPAIGSSFNAVYLGKLRQLDDISFEFDSLRSSFNLKLNEVFYSLTLTQGVQSQIIKPENNIIVSLNGVIQEPGVSFQLVGSRIIFAEVPRAGSTFVAFSYIGSDADVIASEIIPPIEPGDQLEIEAEDLDRTVAIIESSNSLVTFDYTGSVLGRNAAALSSLITGRVSSLQLTSTGDGYTSRPTVSFDSLTGFDAQAKALVGIARVNVVNRGSGYAYPSILVDNNVPDVNPGFGFKYDDDDLRFDSNAVTFDQA